MDYDKTLAAVALGMALCVSGCGGSGGNDGAAATSGSQQGPDQVMQQFLGAIKKGDDKQASSLLTELARKKTSEMEMVVAPPGSDTASYKILETEIENNEAQVATEWTDLDADGRPHTDPIVWLLRREPAGWRIKGMGTRIFPDMDRIVLNFEDPVDMLHKQQEAEAEIARREATLDVEAGDSATGEPATVR